MELISPLWVSIVFSVFFFGIILIWWWKYHKTYPVVLDSCQRLGLFASFSIFTLLVAYHRAYDTCLAFIFIFLVFQWIENPAIIAQTIHHRRNLVIFLGFVILILSLPARGFAYLGMTSWPLIEKTWLFPAIQQCNIRSADDAGSLHLFSFQITIASEFDDKVQLDADG